MFAAQSIFTILSTRDGKATMAGTAGLTALRAEATVSMLGEPVAYRVFSRCRDQTTYNDCAATVQQPE
jgi:hypothetical protein